VVGAFAVVGAGAVVGAFAVVVGGGAEVVFAATGAWHSAFPPDVTQLGLSFGQHAEFEGQALSVKDKHPTVGFGVQFPSSSHSSSTASWGNAHASRRRILDLTWLPCRDGCPSLSTICSGSFSNVSPGPNPPINPGFAAAAAFVDKNRSPTASTRSPRGLRIEWNEGISSY
jgi:hypothetical protein